MYDILLPLRLKWLLVLYIFFNVCPFDYTTVAGDKNIGLFDLRLWLNTQVGQMLQLAPTDRPKSVRNCCAVENSAAPLCNFNLHCRWFRGVCLTTSSDLTFLFKLSISVKISKSRKVPSDIIGEKSRKETANSGNLVSTIGAYESPTRDGTRGPEGYAFPAGMSQPLQMLNENHS